jgi:26S proteasome regulatory subunit N12
VRPNIAKPKPIPAVPIHDDPEEEQNVLETQVQRKTANDEYGSDFDDESDYASDASHTPRRRKVPAKKAEEPKEKPKEGVVKSAVRKIKATANANYRRLNIKGKAGTGGKGKFGKRR